MTQNDLITGIHPSQTRTTERLWRDAIVLLIIGVLVFCAVFFLLSAINQHRISEARPRSGTLVLNSVGDIVEWSAQDVAGWSADEMFGTSFVNLMPRNKRESCRQKLKFAMDRRIPYKADCSIANKDGFMIPITFTVSNLDGVRFLTIVGTRQGG